MKDNTIYCEMHENENYKQSRLINLFFKKHITHSWCKIRLSSSKL